MKIAFVFDGLGFGGIERVGIDHIKLCTSLCYEVEVYNLAPKHNDLVYQLPDSVKYYQKKFSAKTCPELYSYGVQKWWWGKYAYALISPLITVAQKIKKLFSKKRKYDVAIAFSGHINDISFVAKKFIKADKTICWCHGSIIAYLALCDAYAMLYKKIDKFVTLSSAAQKDIYSGKKYLRNKTINKIYNPTFIGETKIDEALVDELKSQYGDFVLMIARIVQGKGHEDAIRTIRCLKEKGLKKNILFLGDGQLLDACKQIAFEEGVSDLCHFMGAKHNVCDYIAASHINILMSYYEGLPTVIIEAMTLGKPCIMTNCDDGEVSGNGRFCKLISIGDIQAAADALKDLYENHDEYFKYSELSLKRAGDFSPDKIKNELKALISDV